MTTDDSVELIASPGFYERGWQIIEALSRAEQKGHAVCSFICGTARIGGSEPVPCVAVSVDGLTSPFTTDEIYRLCDFIERCQEKPETACFAMAGALFVQEARKAAAMTDSKYSEGGANARKH